MADAAAPDAPPQAIVRHDCRIAEELLDLLGPRHPWWLPNPQVWIFRGQSDDWPLKAKAHRDKSEDFVHVGLPQEQAADEQRWQLEELRINLLVADFSDGLDRAGLRVPAPAPRLFGAQNEEWQSGEPQPAALPTVALAQHFGLPTPWLDWSTQARFAAYFACADLVWQTLNPGRIVVWGLKQNFVNLTQKVEQDALRLNLVSVPRAENARLHAQAGLFTWLRGHLPHETSVEQHVERVVTANPKWLERSEHLAPPFMRCLTLDRGEAPLLLRLLADEGVTAATAFPDHDGVVRAMKEKAWSDFHLGGAR